NQRSRAGYRQCAVRRLRHPGSFPAADSGKGAGGTGRGGWLDSQRDRFVERSRPECRLSGIARRASFSELCLTRMHPIGYASAQVVETPPATVPESMDSRKEERRMTHLKTAALLGITLLLAACGEAAAPSAAPASSSRPASSAPAASSAAP